MKLYNVFNETKLNANRRSGVVTTECEWFLAKHQTEQQTSVIIEHRLQHCSITIRAQIQHVRNLLRNILFSSVQFIWSHSDSCMIKTSMTMSEWTRVKKDKR